MTAPRLCIAVLLACAIPLDASALEADPDVARLLAEVSPARLEATLKKLESFDTRHLLSATDTPGRGIGAARQWILDEMTSYSPRLQVSFDTYRIPKQGDRVTRDVEVRNVVAVLPGRSPRRFYVSGHYDTVARTTAGAATSASGGFDWSVGGNPPPRGKHEGGGAGPPPV